MKLNKNGFVAVECIISLVIISLAVYIVSSALKDNYTITNKSGTKIEMLSIAKSNLEQLKYEIKFLNEPTYNEKIEEFNGYKVTKNIDSEEKYYQCYKVNIEVKKNTESINLTGYVFKQ
ncbi:MAG: hypothetical protein ACRDA3_08800 [Peptostreptococcaceae bacterium]